MAGCHEELVRVNDMAGYTAFLTMLFMRGGSDWNEGLLVTNFWRLLEAEKGNEMRRLFGMGDEKL